MDTTLTSVLRKVPLFAGLDEASLLTLAQHSRRRFPPGETLFHEGDPGYMLYVIIAGHVKVQTVGGGARSSRSRSAASGSILASFRFSTVSRAWRTS